MEIGKLGNNVDFDETSDEIDSALNDSRGLLFHQKRLAFCLSDGICNILENYLKEKGVLKPGAKINHQWLKKKKDNVLKQLSERLITPIEKLPKLNAILDAAFKIEYKRNEFVYGVKTDDKILRDLIDIYLDVKKEIEND